jgi:hypothetical protein
MNFYQTASYSKYINVHSIVLKVISLLENEIEIIEMLSFCIFDHSFEKIGSRFNG